MKAKYLKKYSNSSQINKTKTASIAWKNIIDHRYLPKKGVRWIIGNGQSKKFCYDYWMDDSPLINKIIPNNSHIIDEIDKVNNFITVSK